MAQIIHEFYLIETENLTIKPLTISELKKYADSPDKFALELGYAPSGIIHDRAVIDAIENQLLPEMKNPARNPLFYTMWIIIEKKSGMIAGGLCFHGEPNETGEVEIGYGTEPGFRSRGIMSETIAGMMKWMRGNRKIYSVIAKTEKSNFPSVKVLEKNGFTLSGTDNNLLTYILKL